MGGSRGAAARGWQRCSVRGSKGESSKQPQGGSEGSRGRVQLSEVSMDRGRAEAGQTGGTRREQSAGTQLVLGAVSHTSHTERATGARFKAVTRPKTRRAGRPGAPISKVYSQVLKTSSRALRMCSRGARRHICDTIKTADVSSLQPRTTWSYFGRGRGHAWALGILGPRRCRSWRPWWRWLRRRRLRPGWRGHPGFARSCVQLEGERDTRREAEELTEPSRLLLA